MLKRSILLYGLRIIMEPREVDRKVDSTVMVCYITCKTVTNHMPLKCCIYSWISLFFMTLLLLQLLLLLLNIFIFYDTATATCTHGMLHVYNTLKYAILLKLRTVLQLRNIYSMVGFQRLDHRELNYIWKLYEDMSIRRKHHIGTHHAFRVESIVTYHGIYRKRCIT